MARNKFDFEAAAKMSTKPQSEPFPHSEPLPFGDPKLGLVYSGVLWAETANGWRLAWVRVQGSEVKLEPIGEPEPKVFALARLQAEIQKRFLG